MFYFFLSSSTNNTDLDRCLHRILSLIKQLFIMSTNTIALYSHERMISQLYSLAGPQANLPSILMEILNNDADQIQKKIAGDESFSNDDLLKISERFHNAVLQLSMSA